MERTQRIRVTQGDVKPGATVWETRPGRHPGSDHIALPHATCGDRDKHAG